MRSAVCRDVMQRAVAIRHRLFGKTLLVSKLSSWISWLLNIRPTVCTETSVSNTTTLCITYQKSAHIDFISVCATKYMQEDCVWNVMAHARKPDFVFRRNGRVYLNLRRVSVQSTTGSRGLHISGSNVGYTMFLGSVKSTGYPLHWPVSRSLPLPRVTVYHHISAGVF